MTSSAILRSPPGIVIASPPNASARRRVSAIRSRCSSVSRKLRLVSTESAVNTRVAKKLKLQERRAVIPSRRSLAACRPLGFLGRLRAPSRIGGHTRGTYGVGTYPGLHHGDGGP